MKKETKILVAMIAIILVVGIIVIFAKGLAFELKYSNLKKVEINLGKEFDRTDIKQITNEVFGEQPVRIQEIEVYKDALSITTTEITEEQRQELVAKLSEKYETEIKIESVEIETVSNTRGRDIIRPYIVPFIISAIIIIAYFMIRYNKLNCFKVLGQSFAIIALAQIVLLCIMAFTRMPVGRFTIPSVLIVYVLSVYVATSKFEQDIKKNMVKENK
ncbi:MAG: hypothetical protein HFJ60_00140 [Clostridia bacterium]|jgi:preprotein translocase subunit SecF|nr:hypothetical protein [Clostridia bacterium]